MSNLKSRGIQAFIWDLLGKLSIHGSSIIVTIFLARLLEPSDFGIIAMIMVIVTIATVFSDMGLGGALIQRRRVLSIHYSSVFYFNIIVGLILALLTFLSASWVASFYNNTQLILLLEVMSLIFFISSFHSVQSVILRKELNYKLLTQVNFIASVSSGGIGISLAFLDTGVWSLVTQLLSREIIINIIIWNKTEWRPNFSFSFKALKQLWTYGFNMFLAGLIDSIYERLDYIIIGKLFLPATLGFFHQAKQLNLFVVKYSSGSLMAVLFPVLSQIQKDILRFQKVVIKSLGIICFVTFLLLGELYLVADELILILFGDKWVSSIFYFKILALSGFAYPISALMVNILSSRGKSGKFLRLEIYKKLILSMNLLVLYFLGIEAFLYGLIITSILGTSLNILFAVREINLSFFRVVKPILVQVLITIPLVLLIEIMVSNIETVDSLILFIKTMFFMIVYIFINWLFRTESYSYVSEQLKPIISEKIKVGNR